MPLSKEEYARLLDALYAVNPRRWDGKDSTQGLTDKRKAWLHALIQLMRWSGLAIQDAVTLERHEVKHDDAKDLFKIVTSRQKTGTDVSVPVPPDVAQELLAVANGNPRYVFWTGNGFGASLSRTVTTRYLRPLFEAANIPCNGHMVAHRLRDTFAVDLLEKGVPLEEVSKLLGHTSIRTTEKHYAAWIKGRQDRLDSLVTATWKSATRGNGPPTRGL
jgi:integrase